MHEAIPRVLPNDWRFIQRFGDGGAWQRRDGLRVLVTVAPMNAFGDRREWMHISMSREARLPNWDDMKETKNIFAPDRFGYQIFAPPSEHVNIHQFCLHIWIPLTGELPIPNFGEGGTI
jgi:hypothetical protein